MALDVSCPNCGEADDLTGDRRDEEIAMACASCGFAWRRSLSPRCDRCGGSDIQTVPLAIVEKSRGTQLSVVGVRPIELCSSCDAARLRRYHDHRPNPLMPDELPTVGPDVKPPGMR